MKRKKYYGRQRGGCKTFASLRPHCCFLLPSSHAQNSVTIPNSVKEIGKHAFSNCSALNNIDLPEGVTTIGPSAFFFCQGLKNIEIPNSVTLIEKSAFYGCKNLKNLTYPNHLKSSYESWFEWNWE